MRYGIVKVSTADLRKRPGHKYEMVSQGLLGAVVEIREGVDRGAWLKVSLPDGYRGWMRSWNLAIVPKRTALKWREDAVVAAYSACANVYSERSRASTRLRDLTLGCRVAPLRTVGSWVRVRLPDGVRGWTAKRWLNLSGRCLRDEGGDIVRTARLFLGAPYLWGGVSPRGADCSGLVQTSFAVHGVELPRDVAQQCHCGERVSGRPKAGDLLFFGPARGPLTHVGIWTGRGCFIHAGCPIEKASLDPKHPAYRANLRARYRFIRRVLRAGPKG